MIDKATNLQAKISCRLDQGNCSHVDTELLDKIRTAAMDIDGSMLNLSVGTDFERKSNASEMLCEALAMSGKKTATGDCLEIDPIVEITKGLEDHQKTKAWILAQLFDQLQR